MWRMTAPACRRKNMSMFKADDRGDTHRILQTMVRLARLHFESVMFRRPDVFQELMRSPEHRKPKCSFVSP
jgi:hypothetical protein